MTPERWKQIEQIFSTASELPQHEREKFLRITCADDTDLRFEIESLLAQDAETGTMLKTIISKAAGLISHPDLTGKRIGPYRIISLIGEGGMAQVYKAIRDDDQYQKVVAIKILRHDSAPSYLISRFWYERQILANLEHPCIARFLEGGTTEDGIPYFVMEHIEGSTITKYCDAHQLSIRKRLELFKTVCDAVQYAHRNLVIHRDLKPRNILVTDDGVPKLLDFGIAKLLNPEPAADVPSATVTSVRMMTPEYASPEQVRGEKVTTVTDIYSLGLVLYELLSGERPQKVHTNSFVEIERVVCEQEPERPSSAVVRHNSNADTKKLSREISGELDNIVFKAIQKDPAHRYATAEQFAEDIFHYLNGLPIRAKTPTLTYRAYKFARRHRTAVAVAAFVILTLAALGVAMTIQASRIAKERDRANEVTKFLVELFQVSNPGESKGNTVTARELLDESAKRIQRDLQEQPEVQAAMMHTMGQVYGNLGLYNKAIPLLEKALEIRKGTLGPENPEVASTMNYLAESLQNAGKHDEALKISGQALALRRKLYGNFHPSVAQSLSVTGGSLYEKGELEDARAAFLEALAIREKVFGPDAPLVAMSLSQLGLILSQEEKKEEAEPLYRRALAIRRKAFGSVHPDIATSLNNLGRMLLDKGDYEGAESMFREAVELDRKILGNDHPDLAVTISSLAYTLKEENEFVESEKLFREALSLRRRTLGNEHPAVAISLYNLGSLMIGKKDFDQAEPLLLEAQALWKKVLPEKHSSHATVLVAIGKVQMGKQNLKEAEEMFRQAIEMRVQTLRPDHPNIASAKGALGECLTLQNRFQEAEPLLLESYNAILTKYGKDHPDVDEAGSRLISLYTAWGKPTEAVRYEHQ
jgi:serine/threonine-protein kinase